MSIDERIRQLSETIIHEARGPIEAALHRLLAEFMNVAAAERDQAVRSAVAEASASHQLAIAALREEHDRDRVDVEALRRQFDRDLDASLAALREELDREHAAAVAAFRESSARDQAAALAALRDSLAQEHHAAIAALQKQLEEDRDAAMALCQQLEQDRDASLAAVRGQLLQEHEAEVAALRQQLQQEHEAALAAAGADIERERDTALAALRDDLTRNHESALKTALQAAGDEAARAHRSELEALEARASVEREAAVQAVRDEFSQHEASALQEAKSAAEAAAADAEQRSRDVAQELQDAQARLREAEREAQDAEARLVQADERALEQARAAALVHEADRQQDLACSDRTLAAFRRLDDARTLTGVLTVLAEQAAAEISRVAVLTVTGSRLRAWQVRGLAADAAAVDVPVEPGSVFGLAIDSGLPVSTAEAPLSFNRGGLAGILALPADRAGLAVPITVGGRVVAILYADDGLGTVPVIPSNWPEIAEILARHAGHRLEVLTVSHAAALAGRVQHSDRGAGRPDEERDRSPQADERREEDSARRYARLLISEIKLYNESAVEQGRQHGDLLRRLGTDIERARRLYEEKIPDAVRQRVNCFDLEVVRTLAGGDPGLLGQT